MDDWKFPYSRVLNFLTKPNIFFIYVAQFYDIQILLAFFRILISTTNFFFPEMGPVQLHFCQTTVTCQNIQSIASAIFHTQIQSQRPANTLIENLLFSGQIRNF